MQLSSSLAVVARANEPNDNINWTLAHRKQIGEQGKRSHSIWRLGIHPIVLQRSIVQSAKILVEETLQTFVYYALYTSRTRESRNRKTSLVRTPSFLPAAPSMCTSLSSNPSNGARAVTVVTLWLGPSLEALKARGVSMEKDKFQFPGLPQIRQGSFRYEHLNFDNFHVPCPGIHPSRCGASSTFLLEI